MSDGTLHHPVGCSRGRRDVAPNSRPDLRALGAALGGCAITLGLVWSHTSASVHAGHPVRAHVLGHVLVLVPALFVGLMAGDAARRRAAPTQSNLVGALTTACTAALLFAFAQPAAAWLFGAGDAHGSSVVSDAALVLALTFVLTAVVPFASSLTRSQRSGAAVERAYRMVAETERGRLAVDAGRAAIVLTFGVGLWTNSLHARGGHVEAHELPGVLHWLRDSTLVLPVLAVATFIVLRGCRKRNFSRVTEAAALAAAACAVFAAGIPIHARLFEGGAEHHHEELPLALHMLHDSAVAFPVALVAAALALALPYVFAMTRRRGIACAVVGAIAAAMVPVSPMLTPAVAAPGICARTVHAEVVALDQPFDYNRLGASNPLGMIYALRGDVVHDSGSPESQSAPLQAGHVMLRPNKRPRPLTLRMNVGDCLEIGFQNLLSAERKDPEQPRSRNVGVHVNGLQLVHSITDDGSYVGANAPSGLVAPGGRTTYTLYAEHENGYLLSNPGAVTGSEGAGGTTGFGLFGAVNVEPRGATWLRSQVTRSDLDAATVGVGPDGRPILNYDAVYPQGHPRAGLPVLQMARATGDGKLELVHADLNAVVTVPANSYPPNPNAAADRNTPFREFTVIFQDEAFAVQAFPEFTDPLWENTLHGVRDAFPINYGSGGVGAEVLANRKGVGPTADCVDCKYEEFFLTAWAVGDPAMIVDRPANGLRGAGPATVALYPDDPSNVHHSYLGDRVKFRNLHAGAKEHHIFHLHAHQWQSMPDDQNSTYLDSQGIGPGASYTYEIAWGGSGNRNRGPGDSIFHCHFYPHFAQGMWELFRVHDTFERGTPIDPVTGRPVPGSRALPDGEITAGTPIPAVVPLPGSALAPAPGGVHIEHQEGLPGGQVVIEDTSKFVGYPFFIPGVAGHRPPTPPLDLVQDGGLKRHVVVGGSATAVAGDPTDLTKVLDTAKVKWLAESGTPAELTAMNFHAGSSYPSVTSAGSPATIQTNGLPAVRGAPMADPCRAPDGKPVAVNRRYSVAVIQKDVTINKAGWHAPQQRIESLASDVMPYFRNERAPQPLVMRSNVGDCTEFFHTNLVPSVYEKDDFQIRTPTDVLGQHIHLVKFDVLAADGSANGYNYEDGTFSPDEVRERIAAIRAENHCAPQVGAPGDELCPVARLNPGFPAGPTQGDTSWLGARTTVNRWYSDPLLVNGWDNGLGAVFTHDHFGPSTHQFVGLYSTLLIEPNGSQWRDPETNALYGTRPDGGPTSWQANIVTPGNPSSNLREFYLEFTDFQLAYEKGGGLRDGKPVPDFANAVNPPERHPAPNPKDLYLFQAVCKNGRPRPCPEAIAADDPGTYSVNYRNEPLALRLQDPKTGVQAPGAAGDPALGFASIKRANPALNVQPTVYPPLTGGVLPTDPFTPLLRTYQGDHVRIRIQAGGNEEGHNLAVHGMKWLKDSRSPNSGWRNSQFLGISEYFDLDVPAITDPVSAGGSQDYVYEVGAAADDLWNGAWGLVRAYGKPQPDLIPLPTNPVETEGVRIENGDGLVDSCPMNVPKVKYDVTAVAARDALPGGTLVYNSRTSPIGGKTGPLNDPTARLLFQTANVVVDRNQKVKGLVPGTPIEPLVLRARAGDCIEVTLRNRLPVGAPDLPGFASLPPIVKKNRNADGANGITTFNANDLRPSDQIGLHPQLVAYDIEKSNGITVGRNRRSSISPGEVTTYRWYAGHTAVEKVNGRRRLSATPVEFGAIGLGPADPFKQAGKGLVGSLIIEPAGSTWTTDPGTRVSATVTGPTGSFREFVMVWQTDVNLRYGDGSPVESIATLDGSGVAEDTEDSGQKAINFHTEPLWARLGIAPNTDFRAIGDIDSSNVLSNSRVGGTDPQTPVFRVRANDPAQVRMRLVLPRGLGRNNTFAVHGHAWQRNPYTGGDANVGSRTIGLNPASWWVGNQEGIGPGSHFDIVIPAAGGPNRVPGDYLFRDQTSIGMLQGLWGIMRVEPRG